MCIHLFKLLMRAYDPARLQTPRKVGDEAFRIYGEVLRALHERLRRGQRLVAKEEVEGDILERYRGLARSMVANDMRRLGVLTMGGGGNWQDDRPAAVTPLGEFAASCAARIRDAEVLGAVPFLLCRLRDWGLDPGEAGYCRSIKTSRDPLFERALHLAGGHIYLCLPYAAEVSVLAL
ncbi:hypothetical protein [Thermoproteus tenax]|nr:hypothetical protein [Thermoproteus tenax]